MGGCCSHSAVAVAPLTTPAQLRTETRKPPQQAWQTESVATRFAALRPILRIAETPQAAVELLSQFNSDILPQSEVYVLASEVKDVVDAVQICLSHLNTLLQPIVRQMEGTREQEEAEEGAKALVAVQQYTTAVRRRLGDGTGPYAKITSQDAVPTAVQTCLRCLQWLHKFTSPIINGQTTTGSTITHNTFHVESINHLFTIVGVSLCDPSAGMESVSEVSRRLAAFRTLLGSIGILDTPTDEPKTPHTQTRSRTPPPPSTPRSLFEEVPLFTLNAGSKSALLYIETILLGQARLPISPLMRENIIESAYKRVSELGGFKVRDVLSTPNGGAVGQFMKIYPFFALGGPRGGVEAGEGHGPRKEFFDLCAAELTREWGPLEEQTGLTGTIIAGTSIVHICVDPRRGSSGQLTGEFSIGTRIALPSSGSDVFSAKITERVTTAEPAIASDEGEQAAGGSGGGADPRSPTSTGPSLPVLASYRVDAICGSTLRYHQLSIQKSAIPLFRGDPARPAAFCWPNVAMTSLIEPNLPSSNPNTASGVSQKWAEERYAFAGWLAAQAIANGVTMPLPVPPLFFSLLLSKEADFGDVPLTPADADMATQEAVERVLRMSDGEFKQLMELEDDEDQSTKPPTTKQEWVDRQLKETFLPDVVQRALRCFAGGFYSTGLKTSKVFRALTAREIQAIVCGPFDDGVSDFSLRDHFRFVCDNDFTRYQHNQAFLEIIHNVMDTRMTQSNGRESLPIKRHLLKFITGRALLPSRRLVDVIRFELPYTTMSVTDYLNVAKRLPQSHTCNNTLELPNYMECLLFGPESIWYKKRLEDSKGAALDPRMTLVREMDKEMHWITLSAEQQLEIKNALNQLFYNKIMTSITSANTYDLDELDPHATQAPPTANGRVPPHQTLSVHQQAPTVPVLAKSNSAEEGLTVDELPVTQWATTGKPKSGSLGQRADPRLTLRGADSPCE